jgi:uncharacterized protein YqeY
MSALKDRLNREFNEALKSGDSLKVSVIRLLRSHMKNREIDQRTELSEEDVVVIIAAAVKQRRDSIEQFSKGGREDLAQKETKEMEILQRYLPQPLPREELEILIRGAIQEAGATGPNDVGKVMKVVMPKVKGRADGALLQARVREILQGTNS